MQIIMHIEDLQLTRLSQYAPPNKRINLQENVSINILSLLSYVDRGCTIEHEKTADFEGAKNNHLNGGIINDDIRDIRRDTNGSVCGDHQFIAVDKSGPQVCIALH